MIINIGDKVTINGKDYILKRENEHEIKLVEIAAAGEQSKETSPKDRETGCRNFFRLATLNPFKQSYMYLDYLSEENGEPLYSKGSFDKVGISQVWWGDMYMCPDDENLAAIFCKVPKGETQLFEQAMNDLMKRMDMLHSKYRTTAERLTAAMEKAKIK